MIVVASRANRIGRAFCMYATSERAGADVHGSADGLPMTGPSAPPNRAAGHSPGARAGDSMDRGGGRLASTIMEDRPRADVRSSFVPVEIATDRCKGCELCISACPRDVLELDPSFVNALGHHPIRLVDPAGCTSCALCARVCPDTVFTIYARPRMG